MGWTAISSTRYDQDSPITEDLVGDIVANTEYNHDHAVRGGTHATGVRLAVARGSGVFSIDTTTTSTTFSGTINFADAEDGDPNFLAAPKIVCSVEEVSDATWETWASGNIVVSNTRVQNVSSTSFGYYICLAKDAGADAKGNFHWLAIGPVSTGE